MGNSYYAGKEMAGLCDSDELHECCAYCGNCPTCSDESSIEYDNENQRLNALLKKHNINQNKGLATDEVYVGKLESAVDAVLRDALDQVEVHPCDASNDEIKFNGLSNELKTLYKARHDK